MPIPPGHRGNLTAEQELKLCDFWSLTLKTFGVKDATLTPTALGISAATLLASETNTDSESSSKVAKKTTGSKKRHSLFGSKKYQKDDDGDATSINPAAITGSIASDDGDKYGQTKEFHQTLKELSPEELGTAFWSMVKADHPDALLLRFLRARKWDINRALVMLVSTMRWRSKEMHLDDDIMRRGEAGALADSQGEDGFAKKEGEDFLAVMRKGESFLHGVDKEGRPVCFVRTRLHKQGEQSERALERYTVLVIETARLMLRPPVETANILFDMTSFTLSNMDYAPVKFMIKIFEAHYPESLGAVLVHRAPWVFQGIWAIVKGWLDPVVAAKVHFTKSQHDLEQFLSPDHIVSDLGGKENWQFQYIEPRLDENQRMADTATREKLLQERQRKVIEFQQKTFNWIGTASKDAAAVEIASQRDDLAQELEKNYWALDPYIRARTLYDRLGVIGPGGEIDFYPEQKRDGGELPKVNGAEGATGNEPVGGRDDDVD